MRDSWKKVSLGEVTRVFKETVSVEKGVSYPAVGVMMEGRGLIDREPFVGGVSGYKKLTPISAGQLVLRSITAWEAPITVVPEGFEGRHVSGVFPVFDIDESQLLPGFMRLVCQWPAFWSELRTRAVGTVLRRKTLNAKQLQEVPLSLPSLAEQRRIVNLVASVDVYIAALEQQADRARTARNAMLHELLSAGGGDWIETTLGEISELAYGYTESASESEVGPKFLRITDIQKGNVDWGLVPYCPIDSRQFEVQRLQDGDLVFARTGATTGKSFLISNPPPAVCASYLIRLRPDKSIVIPYFLNLNFQTDEYWVNIKSGMSGSAQGGFNASKLGSLLVSVPPIEEQELIVEIVSSMDVMIQSSERAVKDAEDMRSGLLSDLLSGEHEIPGSYDRFLKAAERFSYA